MLLYPTAGVDATGPGEPAATGPSRMGSAGDAGPVGVVALRAADLYQPGGSGAWLTTQATAVGSGEELVFCRPVAVLPVRRRRCGAVVVTGWLPRHCRPGMLGDLPPAGVIHHLAAQVPGR